jgi:hypothetical protein
LTEREFDLLIAWKIGPLADERLHFEFLFDDTWVISSVHCRADAGDHDFSQSANHLLRIGPHLLLPRY